MKKLFAILITFSLLFCFFPALADQGEADVMMEGKTYRLTLDSVGIVDGKLNVAIEGFGDTLRWGANGPMVAGIPEARYGDEIVHVSTVNMNVGAAFTFVFERDDLPDEIWMNSYDEGVAPVLIWRAGDAAGSRDTAAVPEDLVGEWHGMGKPKGGGPAINLTARIEADGSGEYTFIQDDYTESYPFTISSDDSVFSVDIPADNFLGIARCEGTWALDDGILKLDITTTFANGGSYSYTAECKKTIIADIPEKAAEGASAIEVGDIVAFGRYEQDGDVANGPEPIEWIVLDVSDGNALLVSKYALDVKSYHNTIQYVTWQECSLRAWLNKDFCDAAFTGTEQADIVKTTLDNPANSHFKTVGGSPTEDRVFLLSLEEAERYFHSEADRAASRTAYAAALGDSKGRWWLRSPGSFRSYGACVREDGVILYGGEIGPSAGIAVRPALWLKMGSTEAELVSAGKDENASAEAAPGALIRLNGVDAALEPQLFTASFDNWDLMDASLDYPKPDDGAFYLVRFALPQDSEPMSYDEFLVKVIPSLRLHALSDGETTDVFEFTTADWDSSRLFDVFFSFGSVHELADMELLCDGVPFRLEGLPRDGEPLWPPTEAEQVTAKLNAMHERARNESGLPIDQAVCTGNVIVAYYTYSDGDSAPQVLTADSEDDWGFPRKYRAVSLETARWAAIIHPTYRQVGWYSGIAAGAANETATWLSLFDLETEALYEVKVATEAPPSTITVQIINGIPQRSGASGQFRSEDAMARLTELVEEARTAP